MRNSRNWLCQSNEDQEETPDFVHGVDEKYAKVVGGLPYAFAAGYRKGSKLIYSEQQLYRLRNKYESWGKFRGRYSCNVEECRAAVALKTSVLTAANDQTQEELYKRNGFAE